MNKIPATKNVNGKVLIYEYVRGSRCHGLETETSDWDYGGVFIEPNELLYGLGVGYDEQVQSEYHDTTYWEFNKFMRLLSNSNPNAIEALFVDDEFVTIEHPIITEIKKNRDKFVTKRCFESFGNYAIAQIKKARGLNKKIVNPITERKDVLDFCYTFKKQGSTPIKKWLKENWLEQKYCGLVNIPNMQNVFGVYYDFAAYFKFENVEWYQKLESHGHIINCVNYPYSLFIGEDDVEKIQNRIDNKEFFKYPGIVNPDKNSKSTDVRLCSIPKNEKPICFLAYNKDGYITHCKRYKEYKDWEAHRNKVRYESNLNKNYDAKNMCECVRLIKLCTEIALGEGVKLNRKNIDREFLLSIKGHKYEYDELIEQVVALEEKMNDAISKSTLPDDVSIDEVDTLVKDVRKKYCETIFN